ncbi:hypothetical protein HEN55_026665, partial [Escherichia coli]|nr:hypothetical protein [Escherichia coli]
SKTILSSAVAGLLMMSSGAMAANETKVVGNYTIEFTNPDSAKIYKTGQSNNDENVLQVNTETGTISLINKKEVNAAISEFQKSAAYSEFKQQYSSLSEVQINAIVAQQIGELHRYSINTPLLKSDNLTNITGDEIDAINNNIVKVKDVITSKTAADYNQAISNGMSSEAALTVAGDTGGAAVLQEFNRINSKIVTDTTFAMDADGNITLDEAAGTGERYGVKDVVAEVVEDTTVRVAEDGSLTTARNTQTTKRVNEAVVDLDKSVRTNSQDIATNRKAIQSNSRQLQEHNARLNDHQRQIREN